MSFIFFSRVVFITDRYDSQTAGLRGSADSGRDGGAVGHLPGHGAKGTGEVSFNRTFRIDILCVLRGQYS